MLDRLLPLLDSPWLYVVVFLTVTLDGFAPIVPSESVVIGLGALSVTGRPHLAGLAAASVAGGVTGDRVSYLLGRRAGRRLTHGKAAAARLKAQRALLRHGGSTILLGRFLPYGRAATTLTAGSVRLAPGRFTWFSVLAGSAWAVYVIALGRLGGTTFTHTPLLGVLCGITIGAVLAGVSTLVANLRARSRRHPARERDRVGSTASGDRT